ncbi:unannotated protein [freshwater metagenome]|uniref:dihydropteroate synthase n=1 Tax=freshwater metagenome TaxID=449393 RepID=A0A6J6M6S7_9ZZZZ
MALSDLGLAQNRTLVMGILNVTPDSFADGGHFASHENAIARGLEMLSEGVDIIDIGGESTRPGAVRVSAEEEQRRILAVITSLAQSGAIISVDTKRADTAQLAISSGAKLVNDVSAGVSDSQMLATVAQLGVPYIAMHNRGDSIEMQSRATYKDVLAEVLDELTDRVEQSLKAGISRDNLVIDPGLGFAKESEHNWEILRNLEKFKELGFPVLVGGSRKRFLGALVNAQDPNERESASIALTTHCATAGVWGVRVHSVKPHRDAIALVGKLS